MCSSATGFAPLDRRAVVWKKYVAEHKLKQVFVCHKRIAQPVTQCVRAFMSPATTHRLLLFKYDTGGAAVAVFDLERQADHFVIARFDFAQVESFDNDGPGF